MNDLEDTITITTDNGVPYSIWASGMTVSDHIDISTVTVTNASTSYSWTGSDTITFPDDFNIGDINFTEFEGMLPPIEKVKEMCEEYPALEKAYENFKLIYKLVHDDWESKLRDENE